MPSKMRIALALLLLITWVAAYFEGDIFVAKDPKDRYLRYVRTYADSHYDADDVPLPRSFQIDDPKQIKSTMRIRSADSQKLKVEGVARVEVTTTPPVGADDKLLAIVDDLKPLELDILEADAENSTELSTEGLESAIGGADGKAQHNLAINDFIRFKRDAVPDRSAKILLSDSKAPDSNREPRGAVQEKWAKQSYRIQGDERDRASRSFEDATNGELSNAPRVHFVTQRRSESAPPLVYHSYEGRDREGRSRDITRQRDIDLERDVDYPRPLRHYGSQLGDGHDSFTPRRPDLYYRSFEQDPRDREPRNRGFLDDRELRGGGYGARDYDRQRDRDRDRGRRYFLSQDRYTYYEDDPLNSTPSVSKQKRIIYYATLPEIVRGSRDYDGSFRRGYHDDGERERDRDRINRLYVSSEDRYAPPLLGTGAGAINYRFRNGNAYDSRDTVGDKSRYDEPAAAKGGTYPTKVSSADLNVRTLKKNPERRVYSEVERKYPPGYNHDDTQTTYDSNHR